MSKPALLLESALARSLRCCQTQASSSRVLLAAQGRRTLAQLALADSARPQSHETESSQGTRTQHGRRRRVSRVGGSLAVRKQAPFTNTITTMEDGEPLDAIAELDRRIQSLKATEVTEDQLDIHDPYTEEELLSVYEDLMALPSTEAAKQPEPQAVSPEEHSRQVVQALQDRLFNDEHASIAPSDSTPLFSELLRDRQPAPSAGSSTQAVAEPEAKTRSGVLARLEEIAAGLETLKGVAPSSSVPVGVLSPQEWDALVHVCVLENDGEAMEKTVELMKRLDVALPEDLTCRAMSLYANVGDVARTEAFMARFLDKSPPPMVRDVHIKAHLRAAPKHVIPHDALNVLHSYETQALPAPMKSYTRLIGSLLSVRPPSTVLASPELASPAQAQAQAWDLFAHMRYVAHPQPDAHLYALMIRACALPHAPLALAGSAEPERALDLWAEMTGDARLAPTQAAYEAVVQVCARSGVRAYVDEAFRLARECLDGTRDARGESRFVVTGAMCRALMDGAKRVGELGRVRWILAEMVRRMQGAQRAGEGARTPAGRDEVVVDEEVMMHVFHAYAAYRVPFKRKMAPLVDAPVDAPTDSHAASTSATQMSASASTLEVPATDSHSSPTSASSPTPADDSTPQHQSTASSFDITTPPPSFPSLVPQSRSEILSEISFLFSRIVDAQNPDLSPAGSLSAVFGRVNLTPRLVNSYLSVHYVHASLRDARQLWNTVWAETGVAKNARSYVEALERCANAKRGQERELALAWAEQLWREWEPLERAWRSARPEVLQGMHPRIVERAHAARIRMAALVDDTDGALAHLKTFWTTYPPYDMQFVPSKMPMRSTRTVLEAARPLVRMTSATLVPDDHVPPLLTWTDLEILHHRLAHKGEVERVNFVKFVCKAYEGELRRRREKLMKGGEERRGKRAITVHA